MIARAATPRSPQHYVIRIDGLLGEHWSSWFGKLTLTHSDDGTTTLRGPVTDQAELHGLLIKVRDLGATLISIEAVTPARVAPSAANATLTPPKEIP
jgi:hypothetical protein